MKIWPHLQVEANGLNQNQLLKNLALNNIKIVHYKRQAHNKSSFLLSKKHFEKAKRLGLFERFDIETFETRSLAYYFWQVPARIGLLAGLLFVLIFCIVAQNFLWSISISGASKAEQKQILNVLEKNNYEIGKKWSDVDCKRVENLIFLSFPNFTNVSVQRKGTKLLIEVGHLTISTKRQGNVIATQSGKIESIEVREGKANFAEGDIVLAGQTIAEAGSNGFFAGVVRLRVFSSASVLVRDFEMELVRTGKVQKKSQFFTFWQKPTEILSKPSFQMFETKTKYYNCFENLFLPFIKVTTTWYELKEQQVSIDVAMQKAKDKAEQLARQNMCTEQVEKISFDTHQENGQIFVDCFVEAVVNL